MTVVGLVEARDAFPKVLLQSSRIASDELLEMVEDLLVGELSAGCCCCCCCWCWWVGVSDGLGRNEFAFEEGVIGLMDAFGSAPSSTSASEGWFSWTGLIRS
jgi:hypothetical protein